MTTSNEDLIGRAEINDLDAILELGTGDKEATIREVRSNYDTIFTWDYNKGQRPQLNRLYEKAKTSQWNGETDLPWHLDVDQEKLAALQMQSMGGMEGVGMPGTPMEKWGDKEWLEFGMESQNWMLSQFLHGEQGALVCTARIIENVPWIDAKYYAATQAMDEARHVEVFAKYLDRMTSSYPINVHLGLLLDDIIADDRWDITYLGMQIMVEGLALAAFGFMHQFTTEPLLKQLLRYVMSDEARHVAFGVLSLKEVYDGMTSSELRERQEFAYEAAVRMRDRFLQQEVWERMNIDPREGIAAMSVNPMRAEFQKMLFTKIVPNCKKLGLLDAGDAWLRRKFEELGVIQFEHWADTGEEYEMFALAEGEVSAAATA